MNREILFRGKRVDNGEWVYGYFVKSDGLINNGKCFILPTVADFSYGDNGNRIRIGCFVEVDSDTVGQYTGLIDKNGNKIFEADILRFGNKSLLVWWNEEAFQWQAKEVYGYDIITKENWLDNDCANIDLGWIASEVACVGKMTTEIIGNIYDNPDMLTDK